jgi:hypothetical protein
MFDWAIVTGVAATLLIGMEVFKFGLRMERRAAPGAVRKTVRGQAPSRA